jgi:hypothetical protein
MQERRRFKQFLSLSERLDEEATRIRAEATGIDRDRLVRKARQLETAMRFVAGSPSPAVTRKRLTAVVRVTNPAAFSGQGSVILLKMLDEHAAVERGAQSLPLIQGAACCAGRGTALSRARLKSSEPNQR